MNRGLSLPRLSEAGVGEEGAETVVTWEREGGWVGEGRGLPVFDDNRYPLALWRCCRLDWYMFLMRG